MPHFVIKALPFTTRVAHGAKNILAADQARAKKLMRGLHPHGPVAFHSRHKPHHHHHRAPHGAAGVVDETGDPQISEAAGAGSIDVTDSGMSLSRYYNITWLY